MPQVSLIIPVYNVAQHIEACLSSLIAQTMDEIEIILIDDHGKDDSIQLAQAYVEAHPSKKLFRFLATPHNMGPGAARNIGIEAATGEYIGFVDSDDVVTPDYCLQLHTIAKTYEADLAYCQALLVKAQEKTPMRNPVIESGAFDEEKRRFFFTRFTTMMWTFLYRRELIMEYNIRFPNTRSAEDSYFLTCSLLAAKRIACIDKPMYHYLIHEESLSESRNPQRYIDKVKSFDLLMQFAKARGLYDANKEELDYIYLKKGYLLGLLTYIYNEEQPIPLIVHKMYVHMLSYVPCYKENPHYRVDYKLRLLHAFIKRCARAAFIVLPYYIRKTKMKL